MKITLQGILLCLLLLIYFPIFLYTSFETSCYLFLPYSFAYNLTLLFAVVVQCFHSPSSLAFGLRTFSLTPSPSLFVPPLFVPFPLSFFSTLFSPGLLFPPSSIQLDRSKHLTMVSPTVVTWIGQHTNKWEWLSSDSLMKNFWYLC